MTDEDIPEPWRSFSKDLNERHRYESELRPYLPAGTEQRNDLTRDLWAEIIAEIGAR